MTIYKKIILYFLVKIHFEGITVLLIGLCCGRINT